MEGVGYCSLFASLATRFRDCWIIRSKRPSEAVSANLNFCPDGIPRQ